MKKGFLSLVLLAAVCSLFVSCHKVTLDSVYSLTVQWQERKSDSEPLPLTTAKVYAFYVDAKQWEVTSIEDARNGIITAVGDPTNKRNYDVTTVGEGEFENVFKFAFLKAPVMLVVADENYPMYATGNANVVPDLPNMYVTVKFLPLDWKEGDKDPVVKEPWKYYGYKDVHIPIDTDLKIIPSVWEKGATQSILLSSAKCYAFYGVDKQNKGRVTSWESAKAGIAERETADKKIEEVRFSATGEWLSDTLRFEMQSPKVMVVVYDDPVDPQTDVRMYAYSYFDLSKNPISEISRVFFDLRTERDTTIYETWTVVFERPKEPEPES